MNTRFMVWGSGSAASDLPRPRGGSEPSAMGHRPSYY